MTRGNQCKQSLSNDRGVCNFTVHKISDVENFFFMYHMKFCVVYRKLTVPDKMNLIWVPWEASWVPPISKLDIYLLVNFN